MQPEIHIFGITLQTFGLMLGIAFVVCGVLAAQYLSDGRILTGVGYEPAGGRLAYVDAR